MLKPLALLCCIAAPASAELYTKQELTDARERYGANIIAMITQDLVRKVPREMRPDAAKITVKLTDEMGHPLSFFSQAERKIIYVPMKSVRFIDDLATTQTWFDARGCDPLPIATYLWALLRERRDLPPPMEAFNIDREAARADDFVWDVSGKVLKTALMFIFAHEIGHILLGHNGNRAGAEGQAQELAADAFAMDQFAAIGTNPGGVALYFFAGRWLDPVGEAKQQNTHPIASERMMGVAERLANEPDSFAFSEKNALMAKLGVLSLASNILGIAQLSADDKMLTLLPEGLSRDYPVSRLSSACPSK